MDLLDLSEVLGEIVLYSTLPTYVAVVALILLVRAVSAMTRRFVPTAEQARVLRGCRTAMVGSVLLLIATAGLHLSIEVGARSLMQISGVVTILGALLLAVGVVIICLAIRGASMAATPKTPARQGEGVAAGIGTVTPPSAAGTSSGSTPAPPPTSGIGSHLTYVLQAQVPGQGWLTAQKSTGQPSAFGTITATDDELPEFAQAIIRRFDNGTRTMRIVFFRGDVPFDELSVEKAYGDVTPKQGGGFCPWLFAG